MKLIDADEVIKIIKYEDNWLFNAKSYNADTEIAFNAMIANITALPTVQAVPITQGHWNVWDTSSYDWTYKCDKCGRIERRTSKFCPNCGAKMVEPQESEEV